MGMILVCPPPLIPASCLQSFLTLVLSHELLCLYAPPPHPSSPLYIIQFEQFLLICCKGHKSFLPILLNLLGVFNDLLFQILHFPFMKVALDSFLSSLSFMKFPVSLPIALVSSYKSSVFIFSKMSANFHLCACFCWLLPCPHIIRSPCFLTHWVFSR